MKIRDSAPPTTSTDFVFTQCPNLFLGQIMVGLIIKAFGTQWNSWQSLYKPNYCKSYN